MIGSSTLTPRAWLTGSASGSRLRHRPVLHRYPRQHLVIIADELSDIDASSGAQFHQLTSQLSCLAGLGTDFMTLSSKKFSWQVSKVTGSKFFLLSFAGLFDIHLNLLHMQTQQL